MKPSQHQPTSLLIRPVLLVWSLASLFSCFEVWRKNRTKAIETFPTYLYFKTKNFDPSFSSSGKYNLSELIFDIPPLLPYIISILSILTKYTAPNRLLHGRQISNKIYMYRFLNYSRCLNGTFPLSKDVHLSKYNTYML